jgi:hypothetical protein
MDNAYQLDEEGSGSVGGKADSLDEFEAAYSLSSAVTAYAQTDPRWADELMFDGNDCSATIGEVGSALTVHAMLMSYFGSPNDPVMHGRCLDQLGQHSGCNVAWNGCLAGGATYHGWGDGSFQELRAELDAGVPVIAEVRDSGRSDCHHFVLVTGYDAPGTSRGDFEIIDPANGARRSLAAYGGVCSTRLFDGS